MIDKIKLLIKQNNSMIKKIELIIIDKYEDINNPDEVLAALKVNELILLELKYKTKYQNEMSVIIFLEKMKVNLNLAFIKNS